MSVRDGVHGKLPRDVTFSRLRYDGLKKESKKQEVDCQLSLVQKTDEKRAMRNIFEVSVQPKRVVSNLCSHGMYDPSAKVLSCLYFPPHIFCLECDSLP